MSISNLIFAWVPSGPELLIILAIIVLLFGGAKLPELAKGLGKAISEFKKAKDGDDASKDKKDEEKKS